MRLFLMRTFYSYNGIMYNVHLDWQLVQLWLGDVTASYAVSFLRIAQECVYGGSAPLLWTSPHLRL